MHLRLYVVLCVACVLSWISEAFRPIANLARRSYSGLSRARNTNEFVKSISGVINTYLMASQLADNYDNSENLENKSQKKLSDLQTFLRDMYPANGEKLQVLFKEQLERYEKRQPPPRTTKAASWIQTPSEDTNSIILAGYMDFDPKTAASKKHRTHSKHTKKGPSSSHSHIQTPWFKL